MGNRPEKTNQRVTLDLGRIVAEYWPLILAGALLLIIQWPVLRGWWKIWNAPYSYFSHGPLVPFIAGYMVWANRKRIAHADMKPSWTGFAILAVSAVLFVFGNWTLAASLRAVVFVMMIFGVMLALLGTRITRILSIPVFFLLTMIPIAPTLLDSATGKLQLQSAAIAAKFLQWTGYSADLQGSTIYSSGLPEPLIVGIPCSGLRTLISLITFTVFFVYMVRAEWWKKAVLLALSFPLSIFINSLRITMIGYAGFWTGSAEAMHKFHDYSGYIGLAICFAILFGLAKLLRAGAFGLPDPGEELAERKPIRRVPVGGAAGGLAVLVMLGLAGLSNMYASPIYPQTIGHIERQNVPVSFGAWSGQDVPIDKMTRDWLRNGDLLSRMYTDNSEYARQVHVFMTAGRNPDCFHDPHGCLQGGGSPISDDQIIELKFDRPRPITVRATLLEAASDYDTTWVIYWYMMGSDSMPRTGDVWNRNRANLLRDFRWLVMHPTSSQVLRKQIESRQFIWYRFTTTVVGDKQEDLVALKRFIAEFIAKSKDFGE